MCEIIYLPPLPWGLPISVIVNHVWNHLPTTPTMGPAYICHRESYVRSSTCHPYHGACLHSVSTAVINLATVLLLCFSKLSEEWIVMDEWVCNTLGTIFIIPRYDTCDCHDCMWCLFATHNGLHSKVHHYLQLHKMTATVCIKTCVWKVFLRIPPPPTPLGGCIVN